MTAALPLQRMVPSRRRQLLQQHGDRLRHAMPGQAKSPSRTATQAVAGIRRCAHHMMQGIAQQYENVPEPITERIDTTVNMKDEGRSSESS